MLYESSETLQFTLRVIDNVLFGVGGAALLMAGYSAFVRPRRARLGPSPRSLVKLALLTLAGGAALYTVNERYGGSRGNSVSAMIDTATHYRGSNPAIELEAPPGWTLRRQESPDKQSFQVHAVQTASPATLSVETMQLDDFRGADHTLDMLADALTKGGISVEKARVDDTIAGQPARGLLGQRPDGLRLVSWVVTLGGSRIAMVQCFAPGGPARTACSAPLKNLRWR